MEGDVLAVLWSEARPLTPGEVHTKLGSDLAYTTVATILATTLPVFETGTDPTRIPFAAMFAPVAATTLTALVGVVSTVFRRGSRGR